MLICGGVSFHLCINAMFFISPKSISTHPFNFWKNDEKPKNTLNKDVIGVNAICQSIRKNGKESPDEREGNKDDKEASFLNCIMKTLGERSNII